MFSSLKPRLSEVKVPSLSDWKATSTRYAFQSDREDTLTSDNLGFRLENIVYIELLRRYKGENINVFYYRDNFEDDFIIVDKTKVLELIQVTLKMDKQTTRTRELGGLKKGAELLKCEKLTLLSLSERGVEEYEGHRINKFMVVDWLLGNQ